MIKIQQINASETLPIRGAVFQPERAIKKNKIQGDAEAIHLGAFVDEQLIGVVTWSVKGESAALRKLAILINWRRQGIATQLMASCFAGMMNSSVTYCTLLATPDSIAFYKSIGFEVLETDVSRSGKPYTRMQGVVDGTILAAT